MTATTLSNLDVHLKYPAGEVIAVDAIVDVSCGMHPVYYAERDERLLVSTSATELVFELGNLQVNDAFDPPEFLEQATIGDRLKQYLSPSLQSRIPDQVGSTLRTVGLLSGTHWDDSCETVDERVEILRPFERATPTGSDQLFDPTYSLSDPVELVERSVDHMQRFVNDIERRFPDHEHVIRMGGKDSQLIALIPKISDNWSIFSADPNFPIVEQFVKENGIDVNHLFRHDNSNEEGRTEFRRKIICSDLRSDPRHLRWYPTFERIVEKFDGDVIFWCGTEGDTLYKYHVDYGTVSPEEYFELHFTRAANWQSNTHQVTKNYTGAPVLSPYHSPAIWDELYRHYDPDIITKGTDLRPNIGQRLLGREVWWPDQNPGPRPYTYDWELSTKSLYVDYIEQCLSGTLESYL